MTTVSSSSGPAIAAPPSLGDRPCTAAEVGEIIGKFSAWLERSGYATYDPYDLSGTRYGRWTRELYYSKHPLGKLMAAQIVLMEILCPQLRGLFVKKDRYATADAQLLLAFLNLHELKFGGSANGWLEKAKGLGADLQASIVPGYSGAGWGYPFDWQNVNGLMPKGTPHITATPYCFEAFLRLFDATGDKRFLETAESAARFVFADFNDTPSGPNAAAASYTPHDNSKVVNASAYRAFVMFEAAQRFQVEKYADKGWSNLRFILQSQRADGSWLYAIDNPKEAFIDHFHTCFVLKSLHKINVHLGDADVRRALENGYAYYRRALYDAKGWPKSFAIEPRRQIVRLEMYNVAEAITLGALLRDHIPEAFDLARRLASLARNRFQVGRGYFLTRIYAGGIRHKLPFLRWPQAQMFYAMTNLSKAMAQ